MITRRRFLSTSVASAAGLLIPTAQPAAAGSRPPTLTVTIGGQTVSRERVLQWEARRLQVVAARINKHAVGAAARDAAALLHRPAGSTAHVARDRQALANLKLRLGEAQMRQLTSRDLLLSNPTAALAAAPHKWSISRTTISSDTGTARGFLTWFTTRAAHDDVRTMLTACPDHYVIRTPGHNRQDVIEVTGGAFLASHFLIDYTDHAQVPVAADPQARARLAGWARNDRGTRIGAVHHQFRDNPRRGFTAELAVAFPAFVPPTFTSEHRWHLACEFSNWITNYATT